MREERRTGLTRGLVAGFYAAVVMAFTQAPQVTSWTDSADIIAFATAVGLAFLAPLSFLGYMGDRDARRHDFERGENP